MDKDKPDYEIEQFWYNLKKSMINFYKENRNKIHRRNIEKWSDNLNKLQKEKKYNLIEKYIIDYITCYGIDIIKYGGIHHLNILRTNIKRWDKIKKKYNIFEEKDKTLFYICIDIAMSLYKSNISYKDIFEDIELIIINKSFTDIIKLALLYHKTSILDKLLNYNSEIVLNELEHIVNKEFINDLNKNQKITSKNIFKLYNK
jgi:hypothetical protein